MYNFTYETEASVCALTNWDTRGFICLIKAKFTSNLQEQGLLCCWLSTEPIYIIVRMQRWVNLNDKQQEVKKSKKIFTGIGLETFLNKHTAL